MTHTSSKDRIGAAVEAAPILFRGAPQRTTKHFEGGTHRARPPEETLEWIRPSFRGAGITRIADITGLDRIGLPTILAMRPNARTLANSSGKGFTRTAAIVSAAMEGIELHHAEVFEGDVVRESWDALDRAGLAPPLELLPFAAHNVFRPGTPESWVMGWDLVEQRELAVPLECVGMWLMRRRTRLSFQGGSNGLASGNTLLEAVCSGLAEVIERDTTTCAKLRVGSPAQAGEKIDLATVPYDSVNQLVSVIAAAGITTLLVDLTSDIGVPTYAAWLVDELVPTTLAAGGYGTHLNCEIAMLRAITEAVQGRNVYIAGSRDDLMSLDHARAVAAGQTTFVDRAKQPGGADGATRASEAAPTFEEDCALMIERVRGVGLPHVIVVDLTLPEFEIPVVRVFVPGLEGYKAFGHYAPGPRGREALAQAV